MSYPAKINLRILQGSTFSNVIRWGAGISYKAITAITNAAPALLTVTGHGLPTGWPVAITDVKGMTQINAKNDPPSSLDYNRITKVDSNSLTITAIDSKSFGTYTSGGYIRFASPVDLSGYTARMQIRETVDSAATILELTTTNGRIAIDNTEKTIALSISATDTAALNFPSAVYDIELVSGSGVVTRIAAGTVTLLKEVTR